MRFVAFYRLSIFDSDLVRLVLPFDVADDAAARRVADSQRYERRAELWQADRLVAGYADDAQATFSATAGRAEFAMTSSPGGSKSP